MSVADDEVQVHVDDDGEFTEPVPRDSAAVAAPTPPLAPRQLRAATPFRQRAAPVPRGPPARFAREPQPLRHMSFHLPPVVIRLMFQRLEAFAAETGAPLKWKVMQLTMRHSFYVMLFTPELLAELPVDQTAPDIMACSRCGNASIGKHRCKRPPKLRLRGAMCPKCGNVCFDRTALNEHLIRCVGHDDHGLLLALIAFRVEGEVTLGCCSVKPCSFATFVPAVWSAHIILHLRIAETRRGTLRDLHLPPLYEWRQEGERLIPPRELLRRMMDTFQNLSAQSRTFVPDIDLRYSGSGTFVRDRHGAFRSMLATSESSGRPPLASAVGVPVVAATATAVTATITTSSIGATQVTTTTSALPLATGSAAKSIVATSEEFKGARPRTCLSSTVFAPAGLAVRARARPISPPPGFSQQHFVAALGLRPRIPTPTAEVPPPPTTSVMTSAGFELETPAPDTDVSEEDRLAGHLAVPLPPSPSDWGSPPPSESGVARGSPVPLVAPDFTIPRLQKSATDADRQSILTRPEPEPERYWIEADLRSRRAREQQGDVPHTVMSTITTSAPEESTVTVASFSTSALDPVCPPEIVAAFRAFEVDAMDDALAASAQDVTTSVPETSASVLIRAAAALQRQSSTSSASSAVHTTTGDVSALSLAPRRNSRPPHRVEASGSRESRETSRVSLQMLRPPPGRPQYRGLLYSARTMMPLAQVHVYGFELPPRLLRVESEHAAGRGYFSPSSYNRRIAGADLPLTDIVAYMPVHQVQPATGTLWVREGQFAFDIDLLQHDRWYVTGEDRSVILTVYRLIVGFEAEDGGH